MKKKNQQTPNREESICKNSSINFLVFWLTGKFFARKHG
jgi:hypothetical protein